MSELYAHEKSVRTRVREAIGYQAKLITKESGYRNTIKDVFFEIPSLNQLTQHPSIAVIFGDEKVLNEDQSDQLWHKELPVLFMVYLDTSEPTLGRETILMDLEKHFWREEADGSRGVLKGEDGEAACMVATNKGNNPFGMFLNKPKVGTTFQFTVFYGQDILDPTVAG